MRKFQTSERKINLAFEEFKKMHGFSWDYCGMKMEEDPISLTNYITYDRCTLLMVSKQCKLMNWPFFSPLDCVTGNYVDILKKWMEELDINSTDLVKLSYPGLKKSAFKRYRDTIYQGFSSKSFTAFHAACLRKGLKRPTIDPIYLLDKEGLSNFISDFEDPKKKQLEFSL